MNEKYIPLIISLLWAVFTTGVLWHLGKVIFLIARSKQKDAIRKEKPIPIMFRLVLSFTPVLFPFVKRSEFRTIRSNTGKKLTSAGYDDTLQTEEFMALRILVPLVLGPSLVLLAAIFLSTGKINVSLTRQVALYAALFLWTLFYPTMWLNGVIAARHKSIIRALPFVMDLLTLSVEAGMDFMAAIRNIVERRPMDPIGEELNRVLFEIQLGKTRRESLRAMSNRINHGDIRSLVTALVQADELGVSLGAILRIQSDQIRMKRFMRAEKLANEAPVKLLFPLLACIFPAVVLILLGPMILQILQHGF